MDRMSDCRDCRDYDICPCGREGHDTGTSIGYSIGECRDYKRGVCDDLHANNETWKADL